MNNQKLLESVLNSRRTISEVFDKKRLYQTWNVMTQRAGYWHPTPKDMTADQFKKIASEVISACGANDFHHGHENEAYEYLMRLFTGRTQGDDPDILDSNPAPRDVGQEHETSGWLEGINNLVGLVNEDCSIPRNIIRRKS